MFSIFLDLRLILNVVYCIPLHIFVYTLPIVPNLILGFFPRKSYNLLQYIVWQTECSSLNWPKYIVHIFNPHPPLTSYHLILSLSKHSLNKVAHDPFLEKENILKTPQFYWTVNDILQIRMLNKDAWTLLDFFCIPSILDPCRLLSVVIVLIWSLNPVFLLRMPVKVHLFLFWVFLLWIHFLQLDLSLLRPTRLIPAGKNKNKFKL